jgi:1,4-alpha-glucan branching enzyme
MPRRCGGRKLDRRRVYFSLNATDATQVSLAGTFNEWDPGTRRLKRGKNGLWRTHMMLEPGVYEYRYLVDGQWRNDPHAPTVPNAFGSENSVRLVEAIRRA